MDMFFVRDILLVEVVDVDFLLAVRGAEELEEVALELVGEVVDVFAGVFADEEHLADVGFGLGVAFEAVLVASLLFAGLAVPVASQVSTLMSDPNSNTKIDEPSEALEAFGFELVVEIFGRAHLGFGHDGGSVVSGLEGAV